MLLPNKPIAILGLGLKSKLNMLRSWLGVFFTVLLWANCSFGLAAEWVMVENNASVLEGTLIQVSKLPQPGNNAYPDCYYTAIVDVHQIVAGQSIPKRIIIVLPGFFGRKYAPESNYKAGDKVRATVVPFASMPERVRQTQQADEIEDVDLEFYFPQKITKVLGFEDVKGTKPFSGSHNTAVDLSTNVSIDTKAKTARREQIQRDLQEIERLLAQSGGDWDKWFQSQKGIREQYKKQYQAKAQKWVGDSFFSAGFIADDGVYSSEFVKSVVAFKEYLATQNVDLILVRIPYKGEIVDDLFTGVPSQQVYNPYLLRLYKALLEADVEVVSDVIPRAKKERLKFPLMYWYQDFTEPHPAEGIAWVVADAVAERLARYSKISNSPKEAFTLRRVSTGTNKSPYSHIFYWPNGNAQFNPEDYAEFSAVYTAEGKNFIPKQGIDSQILVVGSSFIDFPSLALGSNIPAYLAYKTGIKPDILFRAGSDAGIPRAIAREGKAFLKNRTVCIFPMVPQMAYSALSSPPIINPSERKKVLVASYAGRDLSRHIRFHDTSTGAFTYDDEGALTAHPVDANTRKGGRFTLSLPDQALHYSFLMIEFESKIGDDAVIEIAYGKQVDTIFKSSTQKNKEDIVIFRPETAIAAEVNFRNIRANAPTTIRTINVYGLQD